MWLDSQLWTVDHSTTNGLKEIKHSFNTLTIPLQVAGFEEQKHYPEWHSLQTTIKALFIHLQYKEIWGKFFVYQRSEFPNISLLRQLAMTMSSSNSPVEREFSILATILMNLQLTMAHKTMEDCILIAGNENAGNKQEKEKILNNATKNTSVEELTRKTWERKKPEKERNTNCSRSICQYNRAIVFFVVAIVM